MRNYSQCAQHAVAAILLLWQPRVDANWVRSEAEGLIAPPPPNIRSPPINWHHAAACEMWCTAWIKDDNAFACGKRDCLGNKISTV